MKVKVFGTSYSVSLSDKTPDSTMFDQRNIGYVDHDKCKIVLFRDLSPVDMQETLFHEIVHAVDRQTAGGADLSERKTKRIAWGIWKVMKDNQEIVPLLFGIPVEEKKMAKKKSKKRC